jgi:hypothetical protein
MRKATINSRKHQPFTHVTGQDRLNAVSSGTLHGGGNVMLPHRVDSPTPRPAPEGGEVLAAGRARGPDAKPASNPKPLSVKAFSMLSRVRCAGLRPPWTASKMPLRLRPSNRPCHQEGQSTACQLPLETTLGPKITAEFNAAAIAYATVFEDTGCG